MESQLLRVRGHRVYQFTIKLSWLIAVSWWSCSKSNKRKYKRCHLSIRGKSSKWESLSSFRFVKVPNNPMGSTCAFQTNLIIYKIPWVGEFHWKSTEWCSVFLGTRTWEENQSIIVTVRVVAHILEHPFKRIFFEKCFKVEKVVCENLLNTALLWCAKENNKEENIWRECHLETDEERCFTVIPAISLGQQLTLGWWNAWDVDLKLAEIVVQKIWLNHELDNWR